MIVIKIIFLLFSSVVSAHCMNEIRKLPREDLSPKQNIRRMDWLMCKWVLVDLALSFLIGVLNEKDITYEVGIIVDIICIVWLVLWGTIYVCIISGVKKRMKEYLNVVEHNFSDIYVYKVTSNLIYCAFGSIAVCKGLFIFLEAVWIWGKPI